MGKSWKQPLVEMYGKDAYIRLIGPVWHSLFHSFFTEISSSYNKQQSSAQLINSAAYRKELKAENKHKLLFNSFLDKLIFQQAEALPNRAIVVRPFPGSCASRSYVHQTAFFYCLSTLDFYIHVILVPR
jgi:hypothetical protein